MQCVWSSRALPLEEVCGYEALWLVGHGVAEHFAFGLSRDRRAVGQGEAVKGGLSLTLEVGWSGRQRWMDGWVER